jgi:hypothetical protein
LNYRVVWEIDVEADNALDAAYEARRAQLPGTEALVFICKQKGEPPVIVDLLEHERKL